MRGWCLPAPDKLHIVNIIPPSSHAAHCACHDCVRVRMNVSWRIGLYEYFYPHLVLECHNASCAECFPQVHIRGIFTSHPRTVHVCIVRAYVVVAHLAQAFWARSIGARYCSSFMHMFRSWDVCPVSEKHEKVPTATSYISGIHRSGAIPLDSLNWLSFETDARRTLRFRFLEDSLLDVHR